MVQLATRQISTAESIAVATANGSELSRDVTATHLVDRGPLAIIPLLPPVAKGSTQEFEITDSQIFPLWSCKT